MAHRVWHNVPIATRAASTRTARSHCWQPRLHVSRTDGPHESLDGYPQRSLLFGRHFVPNAYGCAPVCCRRPSGVVHGHIARRPVAPADRRAVPEPLSAITMRLLAKNAEERYQTAAGLEADLRRCLIGMAVTWSHGSILAGHGRLVGPIADTREAVREGARGRCSACGIRPGGGAGRRTGTGIRVFRCRQIFGSERAAQGAGPTARDFRHG